MKSYIAFISAILISFPILGQQTGAGSTIELVNRENQVSSVDAGDNYLDVKEQKENGTFKAVTYTYITVDAALIKQAELLLYFIDDGAKTASKIWSNVSAGSSIFGVGLNGIQRIYNYWVGNTTGTQAVVAFSGDVGIASLASYVGGPAGIALDLAYTGQQMSNDYLGEKVNQKKQYLNTIVDDYRNVAMKQRETIEKVVKDPNKSYDEKITMITNYYNAVTAQRELYETKLFENWQDMKLGEYWHQDSVWDIFIPDFSLDTSWDAYKEEYKNKAPIGDEMQKILDISSEDQNVQEWIDRAYFQNECK